MAWGRDKRDLIVAENAAMVRELEMLRERVIELKDEKAELKTLLTNTQEALIAKESPEAYRDQKYMEEQAALAELVDTPEHKEAMRVQALKAQTTSDYMRSMEDNLFIDAEDMINMFSRSFETPGTTPHSLHGNDES